MTPASPEAANLYDALAALDDEAGRQAELDRRAGLDAALKAEVEALLRERDTAERFLERLAAQVGMVGIEQEQALRQAGTRVGAYRLVRQLGRGGMGVVWLAERADAQFAKQVALKLLPLGLVTPEARRRFQAERDILADLEHPHIARLLDGGITEEGTPYYVMEYVDGKPLDIYCREQDLSLNARLALFRRVCDAVAYAHRNLIVHRDLKPANILVTQDGVPKLLDFGIAKLVAESGGREATATVLAERRLTPVYAAPELLRGEPVTTGCDVYALGVVLYEMLARRLPFERETVNDPAWRERAATTPPRLPSAATDDSAQAKPLRGDLDHIVLTAMHRDPARRYPTVNALMQDLKRHRQRLPVSARPDTWAYRTSRFLRRHTAAAASALVVALALIALSGVALWQAHERGLAAQRAGAVRDFLVELFQSANPDETLGKEVTVREIFDQGVKRVRTELDAAPRVQADLLLVMADVAQGLGQDRQGLALATESLALHEELYGDDSAETATALQLRGALLRNIGEYDKARATLKRAAALHRRELGATSTPYIMDIRELGDLELMAGRPDAAAEHLLQALDHFPERADEYQDERGMILARLAYARRLQGRLDEAGALYEKALGLLKRTLGSKHYETIVAQGNYAVVAIYQGHYEQAEALTRDVLVRLESLYPPGHVLTMNTRNTLGSIYLRLGEYVKAEATFRTLVADWSETENPNRRAALAARKNLAGSLLKQDKLKEAKVLYLEVLAHQRSALGERHPRVARVLVPLATIAMSQGQFDEALQQATLAYDIWREAYVEEHPKIAISLHQLGEIARARGQDDAAREYFTRAYQMRLALLGEQHPDTVASKEALSALGNGAP